MANTCLQFTGFVMSFLGWIGLIIATATNEWVVTCKYNMNTCKKMDELEAKGLWADCVISTALYHCITLTQILELPAYIQTSRALMVTASILGLPAVALVLMSMSCINLGSEPESAKNKRSVLGGTIMLLTAFCGIVSTVWFPIGAHHERGLMSFGFSLYSGAPLIPAPPPLTTPKVLTCELRDYCSDLVSTLFLLSLSLYFHLFQQCLYLQW
uniref:Claudin n=1 Tax=Cyprinus carpio TaxID=7962 RepID=A0A8C2KDY6_CYPCA